MWKNISSLSLMLVSCSFFFSENVNAGTTPIEHKVEVSQQNGKVSGTVTDSFGPVTGASVLVKGTTNGTITDIDGNFSLSGVKQGDILQVSFLGYITQEISYANQSTLSIYLEEDTQKLDEVVVTALGIKREKKALGYSVSSVKSEEITNAGTPMNAMQALYGKTSGLQLAGTNAGPTGGMNIKVRNSVSLNKESSTRPLIVVDGIPIYDKDTEQTRSSANGGDHGSGLNDINPEDIESIEILKGAKAAVLYGSEGANGVMLITTKSGTKRGLGIDFGVNYSWNKAAYYADVQNEFGWGKSPGESAMKNISDDGFYMSTDPLTGQLVESTWRDAGGNFGPRLDGRKLLWFDDSYQNYIAQKNNMTDMYRTGHQSNVNFAISNSGDLGSFRLSYNYRDYQGITVGAENKSHSFNFSTDVKANEWIKIKANTSYTNTKDHNAPYNIQDLNTYGLARELDVNYIRNTLVTDQGYNKYAGERWENLSRPAQNVAEYYWSQLRNSNDYTRNHFIQSINVDVKFNDKFSWTSLGGMDYTVSDQEVKNMFELSMEEDSKQGYYGLRSIRNTVLYAQSSFNYDQDLSDKWNLNAMVGGSVKRNLYENQNQFITETFAVENWFSMVNTREAYPRSERERGKDILLSVFGSVQLAYANQLYIELQARNDWSSILPPQNNNYFYPGASVSWIFTERFDIPTMNFGKVRASWADVGRPGPRYFGNVDFKFETYGGSPTLSVGDELPPADFASSAGGFPKPNLKPERKREYEVGFEANFFHGNRIGIDFSYFHNNTYNQIVELPVPNSSGVKKVRLNAGDIAQNGIEFSINTKPVMTRDWTWTVGLNLAKYGTKIKKLGKGIERHILSESNGAYIVAPEGGEYGEVWVRPYKVDDEGRRVVKDNGVWDLDNTKWKKMGKVTPDVVGGLTTGLTWKDFSLNATFDFQFGATLVSQTNMYLLGNGLSKESLQYRDEARGGLPYYVNGDGQRILLNSHNAVVPADSHYSFILHDGIILDGVKADGTKNTTIVPASTYYKDLYWQSGSQLLEDQVYKSDYISLRSLSVTYNVPKKYISKLKLTSARVNVFGNNLFYVYKAIPNVTPESTLGTKSHVEFSTMPGIRSMGIGLNVSF